MGPSVYVNNYTTLNDLLIHILAYHAVCYVYGWGLVTWKSRSEGCVDDQTSGSPILAGEASSRHVVSDSPSPIPILFKVKLQVRPGRRLAVKHHLNSNVSHSLVYCIKWNNTVHMLEIVFDGLSHCGLFGAQQSRSLDEECALKRQESTRQLGLTEVGTRQLLISSSKTGRSEIGRRPHRLTKRG